MVGKSESNFALLGIHDLSPQLPSNQTLNFWIFLLNAHLSDVKEQRVLKEMGCSREKILKEQKLYNPRMFSCLEGSYDLYF